MFIDRYDDSVSECVMIYNYGWYIFTDHYDNAVCERSAGHHGVPIFLVGVGPSHAPLYDPTGFWELAVTVQEEETGLLVLQG